MRASGFFNGWSVRLVELAHSVRGKLAVLDYMFLYNDTEFSEKPPV
jgi:hypothetical protein